MSDDEQEEEDVPQIRPTLSAEQLNAILGRAKQTNSTSLISLNRMNSIPFAFPFYRSASDLSCINGLQFSRPVTGLPQFPSSFAAIPVLVQPSFGLINSDFVQRLNRATSSSSSGAEIKRPVEEIKTEELPKPKRVHRDKSSRALNLCVHPGCTTGARGSTR